MRARTCVCGGVFVCVGVCACVGVGVANICFRFFR